MTSQQCEVKLDSVQNPHLDSVHNLQLSESAVCEVKLDSVQNPHLSDRVSSVK